MKRTISPSMMYGRLRASVGSITVELPRPWVRPVRERAEQERAEKGADRGVAAEQGRCDADESDLDERDVELAPYW